MGWGAVVGGGVGMRMRMGVEGVEEEVEETAGRGEAVQAEEG